MGMKRDRRKRHNGITLCQTLKSFLTWELSVFSFFFVLLENVRILTGAVKYSVCVIWTPTCWLLLLRLNPDSPSRWACSPTWRATLESALKRAAVKTRLALKAVKKKQAVTQMINERTASAVDIYGSSPPTEAFYTFVT